MVSGLVCFDRRSVCVTRFWRLILRMPGWNMFPGAFGRLIHLQQTPSVLAARILNKAASGDIILLHDRLPRGTDAMLEALPRVIDELRKRGFEFVLAGPREDAGGTLEPAACEPVS